jgi:hypothetical protein
MKTPSEMLEIIRSTLQHGGKEIAEILPNELFQRVKKFQKAGTLPAYCDETGAVQRDKIEEIQTSQ